MDKIKALLIQYKELILYIIVGGLTTVVSFGSLYLFCDVLKIQMEIGNIFAWILSVCFAFVMNKLVVFESRDKDTKKTLKEFAQFVLARVSSLAVDEGIMILGVRVLLWNTYIVKCIAEVFVVLINYFLSKFIIFKKK